MGNLAQTLITGATGLVGSAVARKLVAEGIAVRALVRPGSPRFHLAELGLEFVEGDMRNAQSVQAAMAGAVAIVLTSTLLLLWFLDNPYHEGVSGLKPVAMERTLSLMDRASDAVGLKLTIPCDENGVATDA